MKQTCATGWLAVCTTANILALLTNGYVAIVATIAMAIAIKDRILALLFQ